MQLNISQQSTRGNLVVINAEVKQLFCIAIWISYGNWEIHVSKSEWQYRNASNKRPSLFKFLRLRAGVSSYTRAFIRLFDYQKNAK